MPADVYAAPMTYITAAGRQFVVVAAGGHKDLGTVPGDYVVALALPAARCCLSRPVIGNPNPSFRGGVL